METHYVINNMPLISGAFYPFKSDALCALELVLEHKYREITSWYTCRRGWAHQKRLCVQTPKYHQFVQMLNHRVVQWANYSRNQRFKPQWDLHYHWETQNHIANLSTQGSDEQQFLAQKLNDTYPPPQEIHKEWL